MKTMNLIHIPLVFFLVALLTEGCSRRNPRGPDQITAPSAPAVPKGYAPLPPPSAPSVSAPESSLPRLHTPGTDSVSRGPTRPSGPTFFTLTFHHKPMASHSDEESCAQHQNLLKLKHAGFASGSLCVRVNDTPVAFRRVKGHADQILIGAIAGPKSKITARYCLGKTKCPKSASDCAIPKDEFMEAIGGESASGGQWDAADSTADVAAAEKATAELRREIASEGAENPVFSGWTLVSETTDEHREAL